VLNLGAECLDHFLTTGVCTLPTTDRASAQSGLPSHHPHNIQNPIVPPKPLPCDLHNPPPPSIAKAGHRFGIHRTAQLLLLLRGRAPSKEWPILSRFCPIINAVHRPLARLWMLSRELLAYHRLHFDVDLAANHECQHFDVGSHQKHYCAVLSGNPLMGEHSNAFSAIGFLSMDTLESLIPAPSFFGVSAQLARSEAAGALSVSLSI